MNKKVLSSIADFTHLLLTGKQTSGALLPPADWSVNLITNVTDIREVRKLGLKFFFYFYLTIKYPSIWVNVRTTQEVVHAEQLSHFQSTELRYHLYYGGKIIVIQPCLLTQERQVCVCVCVKPMNLTSLQLKITTDTTEPSRADESSAAELCELHHRTGQTTEDMTPGPSPQIYSEQE